MKKIVLVTGPDEAARKARISAMYAADPNDIRIIHTARDLQVALATDHTAVINTDPRLVTARHENLRSEHPYVEILVVPVA